MDRKKTLGAVKQSISQGNVEAAYEQLVAFLDATPDYAELADIARVNQADFYQLKAQTLKGTISSEDARLATNQLADKALQIVRQIETGKVLFEEDIKPASAKAWRYYIAGGAVALAAAALIWFWFGKKEAEESCPVFSRTAELKVMILPFKQTGSAKEGDPAFDIMDGLNDLIDQTPGLRVRAIADVNEHYDIEKDYPNSAQAVEIARNCNAQMLVWGKIRQASGENYLLDVRYRLLDAGGVRYAGDTTINRLLTPTEEANWINDVQAINHLLYMVLANQMEVQIAANIMEKINPAPAVGLPSDSIPPVDTSTSLVMADYYIRKKEDEKAIAVLDQVLEHYPDNASALQKRGALLLKREDFTAAARDLEGAIPRDKETTTALHKARISAFLGSDQPDKANKELESARTDKSLDEAWIDKKKQEVQDSTASLRDRLDAVERSANSRSRDATLQVNAAKANLGVGDPSEAEKYANKALRLDPKNLEAVRVAVEAQLQKGDTAKAVRTLETAERSGVNIKSVPFQTIRKQMLPEKPGGQ